MLYDVLIYVAFEGVSEMCLYSLVQSRCWAMRSYAFEGGMRNPKANLRVKTV